MVKKKNIHVLPTDKPSRLTKNNLGKFIKLNGLQHQEVNENQHIYITSDEEIKEGDWFYDGDGELCKYTSDYVVNPNGWNDNKKIILTTDQDLIKDGVQKIADDFLEWFIKNPNCEKVEIRKEMYMPQSNGKISDGKITHEISLDPSQNTLPYYKIIIPKEPKQETLINPVIIVRNDDKEEFIHLRNGMYRTKWGILNNSISTTPLEAFDKSKFTFYYE